jgi:hypothetical protein
MSVSTGSTTGGSTEIDYRAEDAPLPTVTAAAIASEGLEHVYEGGTLTVYGAGTSHRWALEESFARIPTPDAAVRIVRRGTLEDVFLRTTGHALSEGEA